MWDDIIDGLFDWDFGSTRRNRMRSHRSGFGCLIVIFILVALLGVGGYAVAYRSSAEQMTCTVTSFDRVALADGSGSDSRIYTEQCGVLQNADSYLFGKFNSADVQGKLVQGKTYDMKVAGWRIPFFSTFPNVIEIKEKN